MGKYSYVAEKFNGMVKEAISKFVVARDEKIAADEKVKQYPDKMHIDSSDYLVEQAKAKANAIKKQKEYDQAYSSMMGLNKQLQVLRKDFADRLFGDYSADPKDIDMATVELLKTGALSPAEYHKLINNTIKEGNHTMTRVIGKYAERMREEIAETDKHSGNHDYNLLSVVITKAQHNAGDDYLQIFDNLVYTYNTCVNNVHIVDRWDELTEGMLSKF